jgi:predicted nucleic acid-binding protein
MPAVVSDTSVLHYLATTRQFDCLEKLFGEVFIPPAVWKEVSHHPDLPVHQFAAKAIAAGWLKQEGPRDHQAVQRLQALLGPGESEAIIMAQEHQPSLLLMDDLDGRTTAQRMKLPIIGTVGVLVRARKQGLVAKLQPILDELVTKHRFRLSEKIYADTLREAGELK